MFKLDISLTFIKWGGLKIRPANFQTESEYKVIQKIGEGSFSEVLKCEDKITGIQHAAKRLKKTFKAASDIMACAEVIAMHKLSRHPNVVYMIEYFYDPAPGKVTYVFELMDMSMYEFMKTKKRPMPESKVKNYLYQMLKGLEHLHKNGLFHRDIKPENILVKLPQVNSGRISCMQSEIVKLADLGSIRGIYSKPPYTEYISTRWYRSPECLLTVGYYGPKMDVWAAGCVFYEMLTLKPLFPGTNEIDQLAKIHSVLGSPSTRLINKLKKKSHNCQNFPRQIGTGLGTLVGQFSDDGQNVLKLMIQYDPESRINVKRLVEHRYFSSLKEQYLMNQFRYATVQQTLDIESFAKCKGDHAKDYLSIVGKLKPNKFENLTPRVCNVQDTHRVKRSSMKSSKTSTDLDKATFCPYIPPKGSKPQKVKKPPMQSSKTLTDVNNYAPPNRMKREHMLRESGGPLVSQKQFKVWGVSPSMLEQKENSEVKMLTKDSLNSKLKHHQKKHNQHSNHVSDGFRKTTTNLPNLFKKYGFPENDKDKKNISTQFQSKSFVLPRRVTAKIKLDTIKEY